MAYVSPTNKTTGTLITATEWNQSIVSNQQAGAPEVFTDNGDLFVGTANDAGVRMGGGYGGHILQSNWSGTPGLQWRGLIEGMQTGTANNGYYYPGTVNATGNSVTGHFQIGCQNIVIANGQTVGSVTVTWPVAYSGAPMIQATPCGTQPAMMAAWPVSGTSLTQGLLQATRTGSTGDGTVTVQWLAIGYFSYDVLPPPRP